jgi:hypothetical protein
MTRKFSAFVIDKRLGKLAHPNPEHQRELARLRQGLGRTHVLSFCQGCDWWIRFPKREIDIVNQRTYLHIINDHFDALIEGRACIDSDLVDGGQDYLEARFRAVHTGPI